MGLDFEEKLARALLYLGGAVEQRSDYGDCVSARAEHLLSVELVDAADGDQRDRARFAAHGCEATESDRGVWILFRRGVVDRPDGYVINGQARGSTRLFKVVCGEAYDGAVAQDAARSFRPQIILAQMHAVRPESESYVDPVINNETYAALARNAQRLFSFQIKRSRREMLLAKLYEGSAARREPRDLFGM